MQAWRVTSGTQEPAEVERLLRSLPEWFGIESAIGGYAESAHHLPTYLAWPGGPAVAQEPPPGGSRVAPGFPPSSPGAARWFPPSSPAPASGPAGVLLVARHFPQSAEVHLMAVDRIWHRRGAGRALLAAAERDLAADGVQFLQVKTLGPAYEDEAYASTRAFYSATGFCPLEELSGLWPDNPCLIMVKVLGQAPTTFHESGSF
jgi:GNAT superfamily N-acetyltransferase